MSLNNTRHSCHDSPPNWYEHIGFSSNTHEIGDFFECGGELNALELAEHGILPKTTHYIFFQPFLSTNERRSLSKNEECEVAGNKFDQTLYIKKESIAWWTFEPNHCQWKRDTLFSNSNKKQSNNWPLKNTIQSHFFPHNRDIRHRQTTDSVDCFEWKQNHFEWKTLRGVYDTLH